ncbi:MAG: amidohydrolase family protein [Clostridia bacterium]|nr:amidohydrolase family protein [Oscillospiraceae bacterium]MBQ6934105.1 amidohydrolase family protein [Clostridia bacterium]MBQ7087669.1 amidohydrolase family protein [Clostridia bacterium]
MILKAKYVLTGDGKTIIENGAVAVCEKKIIGVGTFDDIIAKFPNEEVTDYGDRTIMPGMIDMHVHIGYYWTTDRHASLHYITLMAHKTLQDAIKKGVTTVRDVCSPEGLVQSLLRAEADGLVKYPRIFSALQGVCMTGGHCWSLTTATVEADGEVEIRKAIRKQIRDGAKFIKAFTSHRGNLPEYTDEELAVIVDEAHRVGKRVAVHSGTQPSIESVINLGFDTIEHGTFMTNEQAKRMAQKGLFFVPTIVAYTYIYEEMEKERIAKNLVYTGNDKITYDYFKMAAEHYKKAFKGWYDTGVIMVTGTDMVRKGSPSVPIEKEAKYFSEYGMPNIEVVRSLTYNGALALGMEDEIGLLKEGYIADIIVLDGNPVEDIDAIGRCHATYISGEKM